jgi:processive 1,2-diacylglycerol beta-glucosyltransferase
MIGDDRSPRILVLSAGVGAGHLRAAEAVHAALVRLAPGATVRRVDVLDLTNATFRRMYAKAYLDMVNRAPHVLGYFYDKLDRPQGRSGAAGERLRLLVERLNLTRFHRLLDSDAWNVVVNTHFLPAEIIAALKNKERFLAPHVTVTTDFEAHRLWVHQPCEHYFAATDVAAAQLRSWGVPAADVSITGIPVHPRFGEPGDRASLRDRLGLDLDLPVVLQLAGGFGVGPIEKIFRALLQVEVPAQIVAVTGRNEEARAQLARVEIPSRHRAKVLGFTEAIHDWMTAADLVVSKPGGLTSSEALAVGLPMVIVNPVPGQESRNNDFLLENGAAVKANGLASIQLKVERLLSDRERLSRLAANARAIARPAAAFDVARYALSTASRG